MGPDSSDQHAPRPPALRSLLILGLAALSYALAQTTLIPALAELASRFHTDSSGVAWVVTGYLIAAAVLTPVFGRLGDIFGKRRLLVVALLVFAAGSVVSALGHSLAVIVAGRVLQGAGGGIFPLCFAIIRDEFPRERVATGIGLISATAGIGGGLGLIFGGLILDNASYHWIFWLGGATALVAALATQLLIPESPIRSPARVDVRGALVLGAGLTAPLVAISEANGWGWGSARTLGLIALGAAILAFWVQLERRTPEPLADVAALTAPPVLMTNLATFFVGFGIFSSFVLIPQLAEAPRSTGYGFGDNATQAGLLMLPAALCMLFAGPLSGWLGSRYGSKLPLATGAALSAVGLFLLGVDHGTVRAVLAWNIVSSAGVGLAFAAMPNLIVEAVPPEQTGEATGFNTLVRSVGSSLGSQVSSAVLAGSAVAGGVLASNGGYTAAFIVAAAVSAIACLMATLIPRRRGEHLPIAAEFGAAAPLPEPALSPERG